MMVKIVFFAALRERLQCSELSLESFSGSTAELLVSLKERSPKWQQVLENQDVLFAVNQELVGSEAQVRPGDEVALFPPVTGG